MVPKTTYTVLLSSIFRAVLCLWNSLPGEVLPSWLSNTAEKWSCSTESFCLSLSLGKRGNTLW